MEISNSLYSQLETDSYRIFRLSQVPEHNSNESLDYIQACISDLLDKLERPFAKLIDGVDVSCDITYYQDHAEIEVRDLDSFNYKLVLGVSAEDIKATLCEIESRVCHHWDGNVILKTECFEEVISQTDVTAKLRDELGAYETLLRTLVFSYLTFKERK